MLENLTKRINHRCRPCIGNYKENIYLSHIHLAVLVKFRLHGKVSQSQMRKSKEIQKRFHEEFGPIMNYYQSSISRST